MVRDIKTGLYTHNGVEHTFTFKTNLRASEKVRFISDVINTIIDNSIYFSVLRDMMFDFEIVRMFTDIDVNYLSTSKSAIDDIEKFLEDTNIVEIVLANVDATVINELNKAVNDNIQYRTGIKHNTIEDAVTNLIKTIEKQFSGIDTKQLMDYAQKISGIAGDLKAENIVNEYLNSDAYKQHLVDIDKKFEKRTEALKDIGDIIKNARSE